MPPIFNVHLQSVLTQLWPAIRDKSIEIRYGAIACLRECFKIMQKHKHNQRVAAYSGVLTEAQKGLALKSSDAIHGSLLTIGELLLQPGQLGHIFVYFYFCLFVCVCVCVC